MESELDRVVKYISNMELKSRKDKYKFKRYYLMKYLKIGTDLSLAKIGSYFDKDHATVLSAIRRLEVIENDADYLIHTKHESDLFLMGSSVSLSDTMDVSSIAESMLKLEIQLLFTNPQLLKT